MTLVSKAVRLVSRSNAVSEARAVSGLVAIAGAMVTLVTYLTSCAIVG